MTAEEIGTGTVTALVADAVMAPSLHNAQPWRFQHLRGSGILRLYADTSRALPRTDPEGRGLVVGCGAALFNLRVAAAATGLASDARVLPDPYDGALLAELPLRRAGRPDSALAALRGAIRRRHCSRLPYDDVGIPADVCGRLQDAARAEGAQLLFPGAWHARLVLELTRDAEDAEAHDPELRAETARWTRAPHTEASDGVTAETFGPRQRLVTAPVRDFEAGRRTSGGVPASFERHPHIALLGTPGDGPADWLRAGQALERVLLRATAEGLVASLTTQPLEWPELRWEVRDPRSAMGYPQMVLRLGYGPEGAASPRRPVRDVLEETDRG